MTDSIKFHHLLNDYYGASITDKAAVRWWHELTDGPNQIRTNNAELCDAIRHHADDPNAKEYGKPTLRDLRIWVFSLRKAQSKDAGRDTQSHGDRDYIDFIKSKVQDAMTHDDQELAWNVMCSPHMYSDGDRDSTVEECHIVNAWAEETWPDQWDRICFGQIVGISDTPDTPRELPFHLKEPEYAEELPF